MSAGLPPDAPIVSMDSGVPSSGMTGPGDPDEIINLVEELDEDEQKKLAKAVYDGHIGDCLSREPRMKRQRKWQKFYASDMDPKNYPFQNAANVNVPILINAHRQISSRLWDMLVPASGDISKSHATGTQDVDRAQKTEKFFNSFLRHDLSDYALSWYETIDQVSKAGSSFRRQFYDPAEKRIRVDYLSMDNCVVAYSEKCIDPSMRGVQRYTIVLRMNDQKVQRYVRDGLFVALKPLDPKQVSEDPPESDFKRGSDRIDGVRPNPDENPADKPRMFLEQYRWWKLPKKKNVPHFDGDYHAVIATLDERTKQLVRVVVREEDEPRDRRRFDRQTEQRQLYQSALDQRAAAMPPMDEAGNAIPGSMAPAPEPPEPEPVLRREITFMTHVRGWASDGFYGTGLGDTLGLLNQAINALVNQGIDVGTMRNAGGGWYSSQLRMPTGGVSFTPGEYQRVEAPAAILDIGIRDRISPEPSSSTMPMVEFLTGAAEQTTSSGGVLSGEKPASHEAATTTQIRAEEAQKQILVLARLIAIAMSCEFQNLWRLLSLFLDEEDAQRIVNDDGSIETYPLKRSDFVADAQVSPAADPGVSSNSELVAKAQNFLGVVMQNPLTAQNPEILRAATIDYFSALGKRAYAKLIPPAPPPGPPPPKPQWEENAGFLMEQDSPVNPQDDDESHLHEMGIFHADPMGGQALTPTGKKMYERHARAHMASKLIKERQGDHAPEAQGQAGPALQAV